MKLKFERTARGFGYIEFNDGYDVKCSIQESSLATADAIWIGVNDANPIVLASQSKEVGVDTDETRGWVTFPVPPQVHMTTRMHLSREQVAALLPILEHFVETGDLPDD